MTCPNCGQPEPCVLPPDVGAAVHGRVSSRYYDTTMVKLPNGYVGSLMAPETMMNQLHNGDSIVVRVVSVEYGCAKFGLAK